MGDVRGEKFFNFLIFLCTQIIFNKKFEEFFDQNIYVDGRFNIRFSFHSKQFNCSMNEGIFKLMRLMFFCK